MSGARKGLDKNKHRLINYEYITNIRPWTLCVH